MGAVFLVEHDNRRPADRYLVSLPTLYFNPSVILISNGMPSLIAV
jgi:hypothetical protein